MQIWTFEEYVWFQENLACTMYLIFWSNLGDEKVCAEISYSTLFLRGWKQLIDKHIVPTVHVLNNLEIFLDVIFLYQILYSKVAEFL